MSLDSEQKKQEEIVRAATGTRLVQLTTESVNLFTQNMHVVIAAEKDLDH